MFKKSARSPLAFSEKVWQLCKKIPKGKVTTYKEIAAAMKTNAYRAVGNALSRNPHSPVVPCHRVVGSDGSLVGFARGLRKKAEMLRKEGIAVRKGKIEDLKGVLHRLSSS